MKAVVINTRCLTAPLTGVQRYTEEILKNFDAIERMTPANNQQGLLGHLWEQFVLPQKLNSRLLWNPANTGPLLVRNQVVSIHDLSAYEHPEWFNPIFSRWYAFLLPRLAARVLKIITVSAFTKNRMITLWKIDPEKITVIPNGVDQRFVPIKNQTLLHQMLYVPSPRYILALGSIEPRKNLKRLLKAWELVLQQINDDTWLVLAGRHGKNSVFRDVGLERLPPKVYLAGHIADDLLPVLYSNALAFIYPSLYEGFGLPVLEAMACGTPVITSSITSLPELTGDAAILVNPYEEEALSSAITNIINNGDLRKNLREKGLSRAAEFTWQATASMTWRLLSGIANTL